MEQELESLGYKYYTPEANEHRNIRKEANPIAILFFTLVGLFAACVCAILYFQNGFSSIFG